MFYVQQGACLPALRRGDRTRRWERIDEYQASSEFPHTELFRRSRAAEILGLVSECASPIPRSQSPGV